MARSVDTGFKRSQGWANRRIPVGSDFCKLYPQLAADRGQALGALSRKDDGCGDGAVFGDKDIESAAQGAIVHDFKTDSALSE